MFENILGQSAVEQLALDKKNDTLAPSLLFAGPPASGKGSAALELARVLSCEEDAAWNCPCSSCAAHRVLAHNDTLVMGPKNFAAEIAAAHAALVREKGSPPARLLFVRALRKLLARFSPVLWEDEPRLGKINETLLAVYENLNDFSANDKFSSDDKPEGMEKQSLALIKLAEKLEADGISDLIPAGHIRRAAYWSRLAPSGIHKTVIIENAERMRDEARNSLLKILEEPPPRVSIILTSSSPSGIIPTLRSRLRTYRFFRRDRASEAAVLARVFRDPLAAERAASSCAALSSSHHITSYLESFLPLRDEELYSLGAFFIASLAAQAVVRLRNGKPLPAPLVALGKLCAPIAETAGLGRPAMDVSGALGEILKRTGNFGERDRFFKFIRMLLDMVSGALNAAGENGENSEAGGLLDLWRKKTKDADTAMAYNQNPALAAERLFIELKEEIVGLYS